jgi:hypothetical protein
LLVHRSSALNSYLFDNSAILNATVIHAQKLLSLDNESCKKLLEATRKPIFDDNHTSKVLKLLRQAVQDLYIKTSGKPRNYKKTDYRVRGKNINLIEILSLDDKQLKS